MCADAGLLFSIKYKEQTGGFSVWIEMIFGARKREITEYEDKNSPKYEIYENKIQTVVRIREQL